jgi:hypothetical protein
MNFVRGITFILFQKKDCKGQEVKQDIMKSRPELSYLTCPVVEFFVHSVRLSIYREAINFWLFWKTISFSRNRI